MLAISRKFVPVVLISLLIGSAAVSQNVRSAVSVAGLDTNTCTVPDPCRNFAAAIARTNAGGEVIALSSGGYGPFTINQSVSVISPGGIHAALAPTAGTGILVSGDAINVTLRNLWINSQGANTGIDIFNAKRVHVDGCTVTGFDLVGISLSGATNGRVSVMDSFLRQNFYGIRVQTTGGSTRMSIDGTRIENNDGPGFLMFPQIGATVKAMISDSVVSSNVSGIIHFGGQGISEMNVERCIIAGNEFTGIQAGGVTGMVRVSESYITNNAPGVAGGLGGADDLRSFGNNRIQGNGTDGDFTSTITLK